MVFASTIVEPFTYCLTKDCNLVLFCTPGNVDPHFEFDFYSRVEFLKLFLPDLIPFVFLLVIFKFDEPGKQPGYGVHDYIKSIRSRVDGIFQFR